MVVGRSGGGVGCEVYRDLGHEIIICDPAGYCTSEGHACMLMQVIHDPHDNHVAIAGSAPWLQLGGPESNQCRAKGSQSRDRGRRQHVSR